MNRFWLLHPILWAVFPVFFLYAQNAREMQLADVIAPLGITALCAMSLTLLLGLVLRNIAKAAILTSLTALLFFSFGHVVDVIGQFNFTLIGLEITSMGVIAGVWFVIITLALILLVLTRRNLDRVTKILGQLALVLVLVQILHGGYLFATRPVTETIESRDVMIAEHSGRRPDIYFIIMDAFARADVLRDIYNVDNSEFIQNLRSRGFYVADSCRANYTQTIMSVTATLNLDYLQNLRELDPELNDYRPLADLLRDNRVFDVFRNQGYSIVAYKSTGSHYTEAMKPDVFIDESDMLNEFQNILITSTPLAYLTQTSATGIDRQRRSVLSKLDKLADIDEVDSPKLVFAHIMSPHKPFLFGPDGEYPTDEWSVRIDHAADNVDPAHRAAYIKGYAGQVIYISKYLNGVVEELLNSSSDNPPIIIIQGDHGPKSGLDRRSSIRSDLKEIFGVLNAIYLPGLQDNPLYHAISPVNTFRVVLDEYFGADFDLLPDNSYFTPGGRPYAFEYISPDDMIHPGDRFTDLLRYDFDSLRTIDRMHLLRLGLTDRPLDACYADGKPWMTYGGQKLEMADCRLGHLSPETYRFEGIVIPRGLSEKRLTLRLKFYPVQSSEEKNDRVGSFVTNVKFNTGEMPEGIPSYIEKIVDVPFEPESCSVALYITGSRPFRLLPKDGIRSNVIYPE